MFDKIKKIKKLRDLQNSLQKETAEVEQNGIRVVVNGKMEIEKIEFNPDIDIKEQEKPAKDCINQAMKKVQMIAAQKMSQMPGMGF